MRITIFNGSPRAENGNTHIMVGEFIKGAEQAGAEVENIFLAKKKISSCMGCFGCWLKKPGKCVIIDEMTELLEKFTNSDVVVFATGLYLDNVTGIMKNFMDRLVPLADPHIEKDNGGRYIHLMRNEKHPKFVVISNCGFPEQSRFHVLKLLFKRMAERMQTEVIGEIYRAGGTILKNTPFILKLAIYRYKKQLQAAGREIVDRGRLSEETRSKLEKPVISDKHYISTVNAYFERSAATRKRKVAAL